MTGCMEALVRTFYDVLWNKWSDDAVERHRAWPQNQSDVSVCPWSYVHWNPGGCQLQP